MVQLSAAEMTFSDAPQMAVSVEAATGITRGSLGISGASHAEQVTAQSVGLGGEHKGLSI